MAGILLAEADASVREELRRILASSTDNVVTSTTPQDLKRELSQNGYDLLILGVSFSALWLDLLKELKGQRPNLRILVVGRGTDPDTKIRALRAGAAQYLTRETASEALPPAINGQSIQNGNGTTLGEGKTPSGTQAETYGSLSDREYQVLTMLAEGQGVTEIAALMSLSVKTVSTYRSRILEKLNLKNNVELARHYVRNAENGTVSCGKCGSGNPNTAKFCAECGGSLAGGTTLAGTEGVPDVKRRFRLSPKTARARRWSAMALALVLVLGAALVWRKAVANPVMELRHDDGVSEAEIDADSGGYLVHFSPPSTPFAIEKVRVYGSVMPSDREEFLLQIWDADQRIIFGKSYSLSMFPLLTADLNARSESRWIEVPLPDGVVVNSDFVVHVFAASSPGVGLRVGVDDGVWNLHSSLSIYTKGVGYVDRGGWGDYSSTAWWAQRNKVNWMIRVVGRGDNRRRGTSAMTVRSAAPDGFMKGFYFDDWKSFDSPPPWGLYRAPVADQALKDLAATGTDWIGLGVFVEQETIASTKIFHAPPRTATNDELRRIVDVAHDMGMKVMLSPSIMVSKAPANSHVQIGSAFDSEAQWQEWFTSYRELIDYYATFSQEAGVDVLVVGNALSGTTAREADWRNTVAEVRRIYKGPLMYGSTVGEDSRIAWWDAVDYIGISGWYRLTDKNDPTVEEIKAAWVDKGYLAFMETLSKKFNRPVIIKLGYEGKDGASRYATTFGMTLGPDLQEQADCYQAALEVLWGQPWLKGIYWSHWWVTQVGGTSDYSYTPFGKPAEDILKSFYLSP